MDQNSIKYWAKDDQPREKLISKGKAALSNAELLAILIAIGNKKKSAVELAKEILNSVDNNLYALGKLSLTDLKKFNGIGQAKAVTILAALELSRRRALEIPEEKQTISSSGYVHNYMKPHLEGLNHEEFWVLFLNRANKILKAEKISSGGVSATVVDPKIVFKKALDLQCSSIILCHNHPSGNLNPSEADKKLTEKLKNAGLLLEIQVLDHIIFTDANYFSFADNSIL